MKHRGTKLFWVIATLFCLAILIGLLSGCAVPKQKQSMATAAAAGAPTLPHVQLSCDWYPDAQNPASNVVFNVRRGDSLRSPASWPVIGTVSPGDTELRVGTVGTIGFLTVTASNTVTHMESGFATR